MARRFSNAQAFPPNSLVDTVMFGEGEHQTSLWSRNSIESITPTRAVRQDAPCTPEPRLVLHPPTIDDQFGNLFVNNDDYETEERHSWPVDSRQPLRVSPVRSCPSPRNAHTPTNAYLPPHLLSPREFQIGRTSPRHAYDDERDSLASEPRGAHSRPTPPPFFRHVDSENVAISDRLATLGRPAPRLRRDPDEPNNATLAHYFAQMEQRLLDAVNRAGERQAAPIGPAVSNQSGERHAASEVRFVPTQPPHRSDLAPSSPLEPRRITTQRPVPPMFTPDAPIRQAESHPAEEIRALHERIAEQERQLLQMKQLAARHSTTTPETNRFNGTHRSTDPRATVAAIDAAEARPRLVRAEPSHTSTPSDPIGARPARPTRYDDTEWPETGPTVQPLYRSKLQLFSGQADDLLCWLGQFELFCDLSHVPDAARPAAACMYFDPHTLTKLRLTKREHIPATYSEFRHRLTTFYFGADKSRHYRDQLSRICQNVGESIEEYGARVMRLADLANQFRVYVDETQQIDAFIRGLHDEFTRRSLERDRATDVYREHLGQEVLFTSIDAYLIRARLSDPSPRSEPVIVAAVGSSSAPTIPIDIDSAVTRALATYETARRTRTPKPKVSTPIAAAAVSAASPAATPRPADIPPRHATIPQTSTDGQFLFKPICFNCGTRGHKTAECSQPRDEAKIQQGVAVWRARRAEYEKKRTDAEIEEKVQARLREATAKTAGTSPATVAKQPSPN